MSIVATRLPTPFEFSTRPRRRVSSSSSSSSNRAVRTVATPSAKSTQSTSLRRTHSFLILPAFADVTPSTSMLYAKSKDALNSSASPQASVPYHRSLRCYRDQRERRKSLMRHLEHHPLALQSSSSSTSAPSPFQQQFQPNPYAYASNPSPQHSLATTQQVHQNGNDRAVAMITPPATTTLKPSFSAQSTQFSPTGLNAAAAATATASQQPQTRSKNPFFVVSASSPPTNSPSSSPSAVAPKSSAPLSTVSMTQPQQQPQQQQRRGHSISSPSASASSIKSTPSASFHRTTSPSPLAPSAASPTMHTRTPPRPVAQALPLSQAQPQPQPQAQPQAQAQSPQRVLRPRSKATGPDLYRLAITTRMKCSPEGQKILSMGPRLAVSIMTATKELERIVASKQEQGRGGLNRSKDRSLERIDVSMFDVLMEDATTTTTTTASTMSMVMPGGLKEDWDMLDCCP